MYFPYRSLNMAPQTRSITKKLALVDPRYHVYLNPSIPFPQIITRSFTHNLKLIGVKLPVNPKISHFPSRIIKRRKTCGEPKPVRRVTRFLSQGRILFYLSL